MNSWSWWNVAVDKMQLLMNSYSWRNVAVDKMQLLMNSYSWWNVTVDKNLAVETVKLMKFNNLQNEYL